MIRLVAAAFVAICLVPGPLSAVQSNGGGRGDLPIELKADELFSDSNNRTATLVGKVSARQGDITIYSDRLVIRYAEKTKDVDRVEATGSVRIIQGNRRAEAGRAVYDNNRGIITLEDKPKVYQDDGIITGRVITYHVDQQTSDVVGGPEGRVEMTIYPKAKEKDDRGRR